MELQRTHFCAMIFYDFKSGLNQQQSHNRLKAAFGNEAPSRTTVYDWFAEFRRGQRSLEDDPRSGRPATATTDIQVAAVRKLVEEDARVTVLQIAEEVGTSSGSVSNILHNSLGLSKVSARWVPHMLTREQKRNRVQWCRSMLERFDGGKSNAVWEIVSGDETWVYCFDPETKQQSQQWIPVGQRPPQKFVRSRTVAKQMIAALCLALVMWQPFHLLASVWSLLLGMWKNACLVYLLQWLKDAQELGIVVFCFTMTMLLRIGQLLRRSFCKWKKSNN